MPSTPYSYCVLPHPVLGYYMNSQVNVDVNSPHMQAPIQPQASEQAVASAVATQQEVCRGMDLLDTASPGDWSLPPRDFAYDYPFKKHNDPSLTFCMKYHVTSNGCAFAADCTGICGPNKKTCEPCHALFGRADTGRHFEKLSAASLGPAAPTTNRKFLTMRQLSERMDAMRESTSFDRWSGARDVQRLQTKIEKLSTKVDEGDQILKLLASNDIKKLKILLQVRQRHGDSRAFIIRKLTDSIANLYMPRGCEDIALEAGFVAWKTGSQGALRMLQEHSGFPSMSTLYNYMRRCPKFEMTWASDGKVEMAANIEAFMGSTTGLESAMRASADAPLPIVITADEMAITPALRYDAL